MKVNHSRSGNRTYLYLVNREINSTSFDAILHSPPRLKRSILPSSNHNDTVHPITPSDNRHNSIFNTISHISNTSVSPQQSHSTTGTNIVQESNTNKPSSKFPVLTKHDIPFDFSDHSNILTLQSIIRKLEKLNKVHDLFFSRENNTIAKPFFIPNGIRSAKRFNEWEKDGRGFMSILEFMSNGDSDIDTKEPTAVMYLMKLLSAKYPNSYHTHTKEMGYVTNNRMSVIETAAVLSDMGVGDKKMLGTLQKHIKTKFNGKEIFAPFVI